jgi:hypothetical protein
MRLSRLILVSAVILAFFMLGGVAAMAPTSSATQTGHASSSSSTLKIPNNSTTPAITPISSGIFLSSNGIPVRRVHITPNGDPIGSGNQLFNITSANSNVVTTIDSSTYNEIYGGSCTVTKPAVSQPPCNPTDGMFSYQFNVYFPLFNNGNGFFFQSVIEVDLSTNTCYANNGAGPNYFSCYLATAPNVIQWIISSSSNYFTYTQLLIDGSQYYYADSQQIFGCSSCASMTDAYGQSVWVGWGSTNTQDGSYANFYQGEGSMTYSGMSLYSCTKNCGSTLIVTGETSNMQYTPASCNGQCSQTFLVGAVGGSVYNTQTFGSGSVTNPSYILGAPDGESAQIYGGNPGDGGEISVELGGGYSTYSGFLVIDGYSYYNSCGCGYYSHVYVYTSSDGSNWAQVYSATWDPHSGNPIAWIKITGAGNTQYVKIEAIDDNGYSANIYIDSVYLA